LEEDETGPAKVLFSVDLNATTNSPPHLNATTKSASKGLSFANLEEKENTESTQSASKGVEFVNLEEKENAEISVRLNFLSSVSCPHPRTMCFA
jgi:hypothetical protein